MDLISKLGFRAGLVVAAVLLALFAWSASGCAGDRDPLSETLAEECEALLERSIATTRRYDAVTRSMNAIVKKQDAALRECQNALICESAEVSQ